VGVEVRSAFEQSSIQINGIYQLLHSLSTMTLVMSGVIKRESQTSKNNPVWRKVVSKLDMCPWSKRGCSHDGEVEHINKSLSEESKRRKQHSQPPNNRRKSPFNRRAYNFRDVTMFPYKAAAFYILMARSVQTKVHSEALGILTGDDLCW